MLLAAARLGQVTLPRSEGPSKTPRAAVYAGRFASEHDLI
jgi:hypothetical protein